MLLNNTVATLTRQNIARGTTDPGYGHHNLSHLSSLVLSCNLQNGFQKSSWVTSHVLVPKLTTRSFLNTLPWNALWTLSVTIELVCFSARVTSVKFAKPFSLSEWQRLGPIDGTPGSDKNTLVWRGRALPVLEDIWRPQNWSKVNFV